MLTNFDDFQAELSRPDFDYVVPDFRLNKAFDKLAALPQVQKDKVEFLCNECCDFDCKKRKLCGLQDIKNTYLPMGFTNFKLEGRGLGSAIVLEFLLYYMTKPESQLQVREAVYLDSMLDLF